MLRESRRKTKRSLLKEVNYNRMTDWSSIISTWWIESKIRPRFIKKVYLGTSWNRDGIPV